MTNLKIVEDNIDLVSQAAKAIILITDGRHNFGGTYHKINLIMKNHFNVLGFFSIGILWGSKVPFMPVSVVCRYKRSHKYSRVHGKFVRFNLA